MNVKATQVIFLESATTAIFLALELAKIAQTMIREDREPTPEEWEKARSGWRAISEVWDKNADSGQNV